MSSGYEKLGIEIDFKFAEGLQEVVSKIEAAFKKIKIADSLSGQEAKLNSLAKKMAKALDAPVEKLQKDLKDANLTKALTDGQKLLDKTAKGYDAATGKIVNLIEKEKEEIKLIQQKNQILNKAHAEKLRMIDREIAAVKKANQAADSADAYFANQKRIKELEKERAAIETTKAFQGRDVSGESQELAKKKWENAQFAKLDKQRENEHASSVRNINKLSEDFIKQNGKIEQSIKKATTAQQQFNKVLVEAHNINKQADWNKQAGTVGQNYASFGNGFVRSSAMTFDPNNTVEMTKAHAAALKLHNQFRDGTKHVNAFTASFGRMTARLAEFYSIRTVMFAVSGQVREAVAATLDFNQALHDTAAIAGSSVNEMKQFEKLAVSISTSSRFSLAQTTEIMKTLAQAGVKANDMPDMAKSTALFATGAGATPAQAVDLMTTSLNAYELKAQDGMRVSNALTAALNASKLEAGGLSTAFNYLANQSEMMGFELEETLGIIAAFSNRGVKSSTIGTGVSSLLVDLAAPKPRFAKLMKEYKVGLEEINPMTHSFAEVVARLEKAAIPVDRILASMDKRIGKALVTALNIGAEGFELMTKAVTGTDAALVANYKAMQGARAQLNVLKSEFTVAVKEIGDSLSGPISAGFRALKTVVMGLRTDGGKLALTLAGLTIVASAAAGMFITLSKAIAIAGTAAALFTKLNGWVLVLTGTLTAAAAALAYFGKEQADLSAKSEAYSKKLAESADKTQQAELGLLDIYTQVDKKQIDTKTGYIKFTNQQKEALIKLKNAYPEHFENLDIEHTKLTELKTVLEEITKLRADRIKSSVDTFNTESHRNTDRRLLLEMDPGYKRAEKILGKSEADGRNTIEKLLNTKTGPATEIAGVPMGVGTSDEIFLELFKKRNKELLNAYQESKKLQDVSKQMFDGTAVIESKEVGGEYFAKILEKTEDDKKTGTTTTTTVSNAADNYQKALDKYADIIEKANIDFLESVKKKSEEQFNKKDASFEDKVKFYEEGSAAITEAIRLSSDKEMNELDDVYSGLTKKEQQLIQQQYDKAKGIIATRKQQLEDEGLSAFYKNTIAKDVNSEKQAPHFTSDFVEKHQDRRIRIEQQAAALAKENARTAEEVHRIELAQLETEYDAARIKKQAYEDTIRITQETLAKVKAEDLSKDQWVEIGQQHDAAVDKLEEMNQLMTEIQSKMASEGNTSFWSNFEKGVTTAVKSLGTFKTHTQDLGSQITGTLADGLTSTIDNMITSLAEGENAWKSFRDGVGGVLGDIAKALQKYVAELIAVWMVQQLVGMVVGSGGSTPMAGSPNTSVISATAASGGLVTGGIKGKDSVPVLTMPDEYIVKASSVRKYGVDFMKDLNEGKVKKFAEGGSVGGFSASRSESSSKGQEVGLTIINVADPNSVPQKTNQAEIMNVVSFAIDKRDPVIKKLKAFIKEA